jgi:hypothetical protein
MPPRNEPVDVFKHIDMGAKDACWRWRGAYGGRTTGLRPYFCAESRRWIAYRLVYELVYGGPLDSSQLILHSCDNGEWPIGCCNPYHLRIGTHQDNSNDMMARQRHGLPHTVVRNIRRLLSEGRSQSEVAELYGVSRETVSAIKVKRVYRQLSNVKGEENT